jgi:hypothetical protein
LFGTLLEATMIVFEPTTVYNDDEIDSAYVNGKATGDDHDFGTVTVDGTTTHNEPETDVMADETIV